MTHRHINITIVIVLLLCSLTAPQRMTAQPTKTCPEAKIEAEQLPDLNIPRVGHNIFCLNGELLVMSGHTTGFVPTATAEYLRDGKWHVVPTTYSHDNGLVLLLKSGKIMLAGGHSEPLGIGQTFTVEFYNPDTHSVDNYGCLDQKRTLFSAVETDSGHVYISGNWYAADGIEMYDGNRTFTHVKETACQRSTPYVFRTSADNLIIFSNCDIYGEPFDSIVADQLHGDPIHIPLLDTWRPLRYDRSNGGINYFIGDESKGDYSYLFLASDPSGQVGLVKMSGSDFSLLPTATAIPMTSHGDSIAYGALAVDLQRQRCFVCGTDSHSRFYFLRVDYNQEPAPLTLYYTEPLQANNYLVPAVLPNGDIVIAGGYNNDNFNPIATVYQFHIGEPTAPAHSWTKTIILAAIILTVILLLAYLLHARRNKKEEVQEPAPEPEPVVNDEQEALMQRLCQLMEEQQLYLNSQLSQNDLTTQLGVSARMLSECIKNCRGCTLPVFVNSYRVEHAKQLLVNHPEMKIAAIITASGFTNETSFFRTFKNVTGMTPREWVAQKH